MKYPNHRTYELLYARYLKSRAPHELLSYAGNIKGKRVLDLCAGNCRAAAAAIELGAREVEAIDQELEMLPAQPPLGVRTHCVDVFGAICYFRAQSERDNGWEPFGAVVCQQAINYWFKQSLAVIQILPTLMQPDATFVFNTFNSKPGCKPAVKEYVLSGRTYVEMSWLDGENRVHHVQAMEGHEPHVTCFDWISPKEFHNFLKLHFEMVREKRVGSTSIYTCTKA